MTSVLKTARQAAKHHPLYFAGLVAMVGVAVANLYAICEASVAMSSVFPSSRGFEVTKRRRHRNK